MFSFKPQSVWGQMCLIIFLPLFVSAASGQLRGDINLNYIPYEEADLVLFDQFLLYGDSVLVDPDFQGMSSDVNDDAARWTIGDLIHLGRVIVHDAEPIQESTDPTDAQVLFHIGYAQALPYDTVSLPITYFTWGIWQSIHGLDWRVAYDPGKLTLLGVDLTGGRLESWGAVYYHIRPGQLRFSARPEHHTTSLSDSLPIAYPDTALLVKLNFVVTTTDTPVYVPVYFAADNVPGPDLLPLSFACIDSSVTRSGGWNSYTNGGIQVGTPPNRGDINLNGLAYEVADYMLFDQYLANGDSVLVINPPQQSRNSDVNWDSWTWSMTDFIHLSRVIMHDAPEVTEPTTQSPGSFDIWMNTIHALPHDTVIFPIWYDAEWIKVHGLSLKIDYPPDSLSLLRVDFSESPLQNWQVVHTRMNSGTVRINACPDYYTTTLSDSLPTSYCPQNLANLVFIVSDMDTPSYIPVRFSEDTTSQVKPNAFATIDGNLTRLGIPDLRSEGIQVGGSIFCRRGDVNFNTLPYEVADVILFQNFLLCGPGILIYDPELQTCASNANADSLYWTIADFLYLDRVIHHDAVEIPLKDRAIGPQEPLPQRWSYPDELSIVSSSAHPGEVVSVPVWISNSINIWGTTFRVVFDSSLLSVEGVDTFQTLIQGWKSINPVIQSGELFFFAFPDWILDHPYPHIDAGEGVLAKVNFRVDQNTPPGTFIPITFETKEDWGHYNSYTDTTGLIFVQPSTVSGWIFTNVISGDVNSDGIVDVADLVYLIDYLYRTGMPPSPLSLGDFKQDQDAEVNIADVVALINYLFRS